MTHELKNGGGHTPGPWTVEGSIYEHMGAGIRAVPEDRGLAQIWKTPRLMADAHLIAAAPDMLAALKRAEAFMWLSLEDAEEANPDSYADWKHIQAVIAKAEGRPHD